MLHTDEEVGLSGWVLFALIEQKKRRKLQSASSQVDGISRGSNTAEKCKTADDSSVKKKERMAVSQELS